MGMQVNLLPAQYRPKPPVRVWPIVLTIVLTVNLILTGTYWLTLFLDQGSLRTKVQAQESENTNIQRCIDELQWKAELKVSVERKAGYISKQIADSILWSPALTVIEDSLLPGVVITSINLSGDGNISLSAQVDSIKTAIDFWASLQTRTGLEGIWLYNAPAEGSISISMRGWYGREADGNEE